MPQWFETDTKKYVDVTGDAELLHTEGVEMLVETARMWRALGFFSEREDGRFCIHAVTGPDEYSTVVDNNLYTNLMARLNLHYAASSVTALREKDPDRFKALVHRTGLNESEIDEWWQAAEAMYLPYDEKTGIHLQDSDFLDHPVWDFDNTPSDHYPLLLHYHPLTIYRHQVIKQADVVLGMFCWMPRNATSITTTRSPRGTHHSRPAFRASWRPRSGIWTKPWSTEGTPS